MGDRRSLGADFEQVLAGAQRSEPDAWRRLWDLLSPSIAGYLRVQGASDPDDLTSEVFIGVLRGIGGFRGDEQQFRSWVFVIAHRRLVDERRSRRRREERTPAPPTAELSSAPASEEDAFRHLGTASVRDLCARLAPDQRDVLLLRLVGDLTVEQVSDALDKSLGAVKALQRRGLDAIRRIIDAEGVPL